MATSEAIAAVTAKYSYLASWSTACGWRRARWRFLVSLTWAQLYRSEGSRLVYEASDI
ncbi:MAG: hypothetical protein KJO07_09270 [Deltaproteobacteria bacterium]|nr:hypothetical protein [Deltaproteobacteria bacterium]